MATDPQRAAAPPHSSLIDLIGRDPDLARGFIRKHISPGCAPGKADSDEDGVFVVLTGRFRVFLSCNGKEFTLFYLQPGDIFSLHSGALVEAKEGGDILFADMASFERALRAIPSLSLAMMPVLGRTLRTAIRIIEDQTFRDVRHRLLRWIVETAEEKGMRSLDGVLVEIDLRTEDLAMLLGATRQSVSVTLNQLLREGTVRRLSRTVMLVSDIEKLKAELADW